ncbi:fungal specific transcription factor [Diaporthe amygdali]|uniref:fungal specific transcription factor n=1 Tax=Phomopsis amygdali TaxID=1214568 RepID=UPI0022FDC499|nr:fungal specific transcription factor [Diaporthe amygdali]KAJ0104226.1 fungal specific transcription factor [Diaporthe amygdali]
MRSSRYGRPGTFWAVNEIVEDISGWFIFLCKLCCVSLDDHVKFISSSDLFIDRILQNPSLAGVHPVKDAQSIFKVHDHHRTSSNLAYFSETYVRRISQRLGHDKLLELIRTMSNIVNAKLSRAKQDSTPLFGPARSASSGIEISGAKLRSYVEAYFEHVHPLYPFLDRPKFEASVMDVQTRDKSSAFRALYHSVLALGCQYVVADCSFTPGKGEAWSYFNVALSLLPDVLLPPGALVNLQAITAMAIFGSNAASMSISEFLTMEAARMAQALGYHRPVMNSKEDETTCYRVFWVVYILEKCATFMTGKSSTIADHEVGCPIIPTVEEHLTVDFEMFISLLRLGRLLSRVHERLFSVSATLNSVEQYQTNIDSLKSELEAWRCSMPVGLRPGLPISKKELMESARTVVRLTICIDIRPYTPIWILASLPLSAMFVLFDMVIHRPSHQETETNLALLDTVAGYFSRFDYATTSSVPCSLFSGFAHIANQFVREQWHNTAPAALDAEVQNRTSGSQSRYFAYGAEDTESGEELFSQGPEATTETPSYSLLGDDATFDAQLFAGFDFTNVFEVNIPGFGRF